MFLCPVPWRCVETTNSYPRLPTGAHGQCYTVADNHTSCVQPVHGDSAGWHIPSHPSLLLLDFPTNARRATILVVQPTVLTVNHAPIIQRSVIVTVARELHFRRSRIRMSVERLLALPAWIAQFSKILWRNADSGWKNMTLDYKQICVCVCGRGV
jgi:hypothetical protein